jgi:hypothetical protein
MPNKLVAPLWLAAVLLAGCATPKVIFLHGGHRQNYKLQPQELKGVQVYISSEVLAHEITDPTSAGTSASVFIVERQTPGAITEIGPDWIRVSFDEGPGVPFLAIPRPNEDSSYWLATEVAGREGLHRVTDLRDKIVIVGGRTFRLIHGVNARLLVDSDYLDELIKLRRRATGREAEN